MSVFEIGKDRYRVQVRRKGFPTYDQAFATRQLAEAAQARVLGEQKLVLKPGDITLNEAWERYRDSVDFSRKSDSTQKTELTRIKPVLAVLGEYSLLALQDAPRLIYDYVDRRSKVVSQKTRKTISSSSLRLEIAALSAVAMWAQRRKYIIKNFVRDIARPGLAKRKRRVPPVELGKLELTVMNFDEPKLAEAARFLLLLRFLGCRPGELARLLNADIRFSKPQIAVEALDFALGLGPIRTAQLDHEAAMAGIIEKSSMEAMCAITRGVALDHHSRHVVVQNALGEAAKCLEGMLVAGDQRLHFHVGDELDKAHAAVAQRRAEGVKRVAALAKFNPVDLRLLARRGLEPYHRIHRHGRLEIEHPGA